MSERLGGLLLQFNVEIESIIQLLYIEIVVVNALSVSNTAIHAHCEVERSGKTHRDIRLKEMCEVGRDGAKGERERKQVVHVGGGRARVRECV